MHDPFVTVKTAINKAFRFIMFSVYSAGQTSEKAGILRKNSENGYFAEITANHKVFKQ